MEVSVVKEARVFNPFRSLIEQALADHLRSVVEGDLDRCRGDFAPEFTQHRAAVLAVLPRGLTAFDTSGYRVQGECHVVQVQLLGDTTTLSEWSWAKVDGYYRILDITTLDVPEGADSEIPQARQGVSGGEAVVQTLA